MSMTGQAWHIKSARVLPLRAPLIQPFRTALGSHDTLDNLLLVLTLADGTKGYGEAAVATHITGETIPVTRRNLQAAGRWLIGKDVRDVWHISGTLHERWDNNQAMIAAVETALFDADAPIWLSFVEIIWAALPKVANGYHNRYRGSGANARRGATVLSKRISAVQGQDRPQL